MIDKDERFSMTRVDPAVIVCRDCRFKNGGGMEYPHFTKGCCDQYPYPKNKPHDVLFKGAACPFYEKEE